MGKSRSSSSRSKSKSSASDKSRRSAKSAKSSKSSKSSKSGKSAKSNKSTASEKDVSIFITGFSSKMQGKELMELLETTGAKVERIGMKEKYCFAVIKRGFKKVMAELNGRECDGLRLKIEKARGYGVQRIKHEKKSDEPSDTLFVVNYDQNTTEKEMKEFFKDYNFDRIDINPRFAFVRFPTVPDSVAAKEALDGQWIRNNQVTIEYKVGDSHPKRSSRSPKRRYNSPRGYRRRNESYGRDRHRDYYRESRDYRRDSRYDRHRDSRRRTRDRSYSRRRR